MGVLSGSEKPSLPQEAEAGGGRGQPWGEQSSGVIAVTGFGPFCGVKHNPTEALVRRLQQWQRQRALQEEGRRRRGGASTPAGQPQGHLGPAMEGEGRKEPEGGGTATAAPMATATPLPSAGKEALRAAPAQSAGEGRSRSGNAEAVDGADGDAGGLRVNLKEGWRLGSCSVLCVAGKGNLAALLKLLDEPCGPQSEGEGGAAGVPGLAGSEAGATDATRRARALADVDERGGSAWISHERPDSLPRAAGAAAGDVPAARVSKLEHVIWLHLGVGASLQRFHVEFQAVNDASFPCADEMGWRPWHEPICAEDGPRGHSRETRLPVSWLQQELSSRGFPVSISRDAGKFVCNYVYYNSLRHSEQACHASGSPALSSIFVHVPSFSTICEEQQMRFLEGLLELLCHCQDKPGPETPLESPSDPLNALLLKV